jgi:hypothetical protein
MVWAGIHSDGGAAIVMTMEMVRKEHSRMDEVDFASLSFEEQERRAVRASCIVVGDDHALDAIIARANGEAGPRLVVAPEQVEAAPSLHGSKG